MELLVGRVCKSCHVSLNMCTNPHIHSPTALLRLHNDINKYTCKKCHYELWNIIRIIHVFSQVILCFYNAFFGVLMFLQYIFVTVTNACTLMWHVKLVKLHTFVKSSLNSFHHAFAIFNWTFGQLFTLHHSCTQNMQIEMILQHFHTVFWSDTLPLTDQHWTT